MRRLVCAVLSISCFGCASGPPHSEASELAREGRRLLETGRPRAALPRLQEATARDPRSAEIRISLGDCYLELGDYLAAYSAYAAAALGEDGGWRDPGAPLEYRRGPAEVDAAGLLQASGRKFLAGSLLGMPFVLTPYNPDQAPKFLHRGSPSPTIRLIARLFEAQESSPGIRNRLADSPCEEERRTRATATHPAARPQDWDLLGGPSVSSAVRDYEVSTLANPPFGSMAGADMDLAARDFVSARDQYTQIIEAAVLADVANDAFLTRHVKGMALHKRGMAFASSGDWMSALRDFEAAAKCRPRDAEVLTDLGIALFETGSAAEARPMFEQALAIEPLLEAARLGLERTGAQPAK